jgi:hypothetical protein
MSREMENPDQRHVPGSTARDIAFHCLSENPDELLHESLFSEDTYEGQMCWADLHAGTWTKWVNKRQGDDIKRALLTVWCLSLRISNLDS